MSIIRSLLDTDLYKLTTQFAVLRYYPKVEVKYNFYNRCPEMKFNFAFMDALTDELVKMEELTVTNEELTWLEHTCPWFDAAYLNYLKNYRFDECEVLVCLDDGNLFLEINGPWHQTILWEVPLMATISELYFIHCDKDWEWGDQFKRLENKCDRLQSMHDSNFANYSDFGTRRRRNQHIQDCVVHNFNYTRGFIGTSNVSLAHKHLVKPVGTMPHEWIMGISALEGLRHANRDAMHAWANVFKGNLGIALTDTFGSEAFWGDFDSYLARLFDGVRHDSGDPVAFGDRAVRHYEKLGIDPMTKTIVFSDGLTIAKAEELADLCDQRIRVSFGIGTHLTNDFKNSNPLNIVIKMTECNGVPVVKLSDSPTKEIGNRDALRIAKCTFYTTPLD